MVLRFGSEVLKWTIINFTTAILCGGNSIIFTSTYAKAFYFGSVAVCFISIDKKDNDLKARIVRCKNVTKNKTMRTFFYLRTLICRKRIK